MTDNTEALKVIGILTQKFIEVEAGNKVTPNNIGFFVGQIVQALNGEITITPPETPVQHPMGSPVKDMEATK